MPLHLAFIHRQPAVLRALLELGANLESLDEAGFTPLDHAALNGASELCLPAAAALGHDADVARLLRRDPRRGRPAVRVVAEQSANP